MIRKIVKGVSVLAVVAAMTGCSESSEKDECCAGKDLKKEATVKTYEKSDFYTDKGALDQASVKEAYYDLMERFNYPIPAILKGDNFWVCDFVQADHAKLGMGGVFWINEVGTYGRTGAKKYKGEFAGKSFGYLGHDIYLLPGQALPEHSHVGGAKNIGPKMEAWHIRYGAVRFFNEFGGTDGEKLISTLPAAERPWGYGQPWFKSKYYVDKKAGDIYPQRDPESWHFQQALTEGAIVSEYATYHNHVHFSKPGLKFDCTK